MESNNIKLNGMGIKRILWAMCLPLTATMSANYWLNARHQLLMAIKYANPLSTLWRNLTVKTTVFPDVCFALLWSFLFAYALIRFMRWSQ